MGVYVCYGDNERAFRRRKKAKKRGKPFSVLRRRLRKNAAHAIRIHYDLPRAGCRARGPIFGRFKRKPFCERNARACRRRRRVCPSTARAIASGGRGKRFLCRFPAQTTTLIFTCSPHFYLFTLCRFVGLLHNTRNVGFAEDPGDVYGAHQRSRRARCRAVGSTSIRVKLAPEYLLILPTNS